MPVGAVKGFPGGIAGKRDVWLTEWNNTQVSIFASVQMNWIKEAVFVLLGQLQAGNPIRPF
jgi:hypothetical protein